MRGCLAAVSLACFLALSPALSTTPIGEEQAKDAALEFGRALARGDTTLLRAILPVRGKVRLRLVALGPEEGTYSAGQVEGVLKGFLRQGAVRAFDLLRVECASDQYALVHARAKIADRDGRPVTVDLHLAFEPEQNHWVLREIRETPP